MLNFYFDTFFDVPDHELPQNCEYYFNILVVEIGVPRGYLAQRTGIAGLTEYTDISHIKDARPYIIFVDEDEEIVGSDWDIDFFPHSVVEHNIKTNEVSFYPMIDYETDYPWDLTPTEYWDEED